MPKNVTIFLIKKNSIFGVNPDELVSPDLLIEKKSKAVGSAGSLKDLRKTQLQMACTGSKYCIICHIILSLRVPIIFWLQYTNFCGMLLKL